MTCWVYPTNLHISAHNGFWRSESAMTGNCFFIFNGSTRRPWVRWNNTDVMRPTVGYQVPGNAWLQHRWRVKSGEWCDFSTREDACDEWTVQHTATHTRATPSLNIVSFLRQGSAELHGEFSRLDVLINGERAGLWLLDTPDVGSGTIHDNELQGQPGLVTRGISSTSGAPTAQLPTNLVCGVSTEPFLLRHNPRTNKVIPVLSSPTVTDIGAACVRPRVMKGF